MKMPPLPGRSWLPVMVAVDAVVVGIVDAVEVDGKDLYLKSSGVAG